MAVKSLGDSSGQGKDPALAFPNGARTKGYLDLANFQFRGMVRGGREIREKGLPDAHLRQSLLVLSGDLIGNWTFSLLSQCCICLRWIQSAIFSSW